jgi:hypothetical protein
MAKKTSRTRRCNPQDGAQRHHQAKAFAELAELDPFSSDGPTRSAAVSNAVLAGIAAADTICCRRLGRHAASNEHQQALDLLDQAGDLGTSARRDLAIMLSAKNKAQYEQTDPTVTEAERVIRTMRHLLELAAQA